MIILFIEIDQWTARKLRQFSSIVHSQDKVFSSVFNKSYKFFENIYLECFYYDLKRYLNQTERSVGKYKYLFPLYHYTIALLR